MRRWSAILASVAAALVLLAALLPWWLPLAARPVAAHLGATFGSYQRIGYRRFAVGDVSVRRAGVTVTVARVEADTPLLWAWRHLRHRDRPIVATEWSVDVERRAPAPAKQPTGWMPLRAKLRRIGAGLERWLPTASVGRGTVRWPRGELRLDSARWIDRGLDVRGLIFHGVRVNGTAVFSMDDDAIAIGLEDVARGARLVVESRGAHVTGSVGWWEQRATVSARFDAAGWLPGEADVGARDFAIPGDRLKLGTSYVQVTGNARATWTDGHIAADLSLHGEPVSDKPVPPLDITFRAHGDSRRWIIDALHAVVPGAVAHLNQPVTIDPSGRIGDVGARFSVRADLSRQPWSHARGTLVGDAVVTRAAGQLPEVAFMLRGDNVSAARLSFRHADIQAILAWPLLRLKRASVRGGADAEIQASGTWNFWTKTLTDGVAEGAVTAALLSPWLPAGLHVDRVSVDLHAQGPAHALEHAGRLHLVALQAGPLKPETADLEWRGIGARLSSFSATAAAGQTRVSLAGESEVGSVRIAEFTYSIQGTTKLHLQQPFRLSWRSGLALEPVHLVGDDAAIDASLAWGDIGNVEAVVHNFPSQWLADLLPLPGPRWVIRSLAFSGKWERAPMSYSATADFGFALPQQRQATVAVSAKGGPTGLRLEALHAEESGNPVVNASGVLPVTLTPGGQPLLAIDSHAPLTLNANTVPNAAFWQQIAMITGVEFRAPEVSAHLTGTWAAPKGTVAVRIAHAAMDPQRFSRPLPTVDDVDVALSAENGGILLDRFSLAIEGQRVHASGRVPIAGTGWTALAQAPAEYLRRHSELRLEIPDARVAMFSRFLPSALAPAGRLQADVHFERGSLAGYLRLRDAASRPLGPLGVLQQISADVAFSDDRIVLRSVTATSGGQPVTLSGSVQLPQTGWLSGDLGRPKYDVRLEGKNLPFVRQSGLLVRGDLDLRLETAAAGVPAITGKVVLRDSLFLTDVRSFLPHGGGASPARRPPYFAVETAPLNTWTLNVDVRGARFMRVRTPVFTGIASAKFHVGGTLGDPRAIGDAVIEEGWVRMPFAAFEVRQGDVRLTEESPYEPTIYLRGAGRHYGYDLTMEVSGKASAPNIVFTSSPALEAEQVLLMVMTGTAPTNEINPSLTHRAVQIGAFFGQSLLGSLTGGAVEPDRLTIESGEKISEQGRETYSIEYKLNDRWSLTGDYDEFDEYNAGFKWRIAPRKKP